MQVSLNRECFLYTREAVIPELAPLINQPIANKTSKVIKKLPMRLWLDVIKCLII